MAIRDIRIIPDPVLRSKCEPIKKITPEVETLIKDLLDSVNDPGRAGLSANQIGVPLRAFAYHFEDELGYIINPVLVELSKDKELDEEGCLSVPELYFPVERSNYARVEGIDLSGDKITLEGEDIVARCLQHEIDHLDGRLYIDRLKGETKKEALKVMRELGLL